MATYRPTVWIYIIPKNLLASSVVFKLLASIDEHHISLTCHVTNISCGLVTSPVACRATVPSSRAEPGRPGAELHQRQRGGATGRDECRDGRTSSVGCCVRVG